MFHFRNTLLCGWKFVQQQGLEDKVDDGGTQGISFHRFPFLLVVRSNKLKEFGAK